MVCGLVLWCGGCVLRGLEKEITDISKVCYLRSKRTIIDSHKVKMGLCQGSYRPRM